MICFLGPSPAISSTLGYLQRVRQIDAFFSDINRIYVDYPNAPLSWFKTQLSISDPAGIVLDPQHPKHLEIISAVFQESDFIYAHSLFKIKPVFDLIDTLNLWKKVILDVHGAIPEEFEMAGDTTRSAEFSELERLTLSKIGRIITVTSKMYDHLKTKYSTVNLNGLCIPLISSSPTSWPTKDLSLVIRPQIIYAGGADSWQNTIMMLEAAQVLSDRFDFKFFTPSLKAWKAQAGYKKAFDIFAPQFVQSKEEMNGILRKSHFGLVLRDDSIVNRVACPTKMVDYFLNGVIPVVLQPSIGDFQDYGFKYVALQDLPEHAQDWKNSFESTIKTNFLIAKQLQELVSTSVEPLRREVKQCSTNSNSPLDSYRKEVFFLKLRGWLWKTLRQVV